MHSRWLLPSFGATRLSYLRRFAAAPDRGLWLFGFVVLAQVGHLVEHIAAAITGHGLLGRSFESELSHLLFNGLIALLALALVRTLPRNPWVYPLLALSIFHGVEHIYIYSEYLRTGITGGPGLLGLGGAVGLIPLDRLDLHNVYNGVELILMVLGFWHELEEKFVAWDNAG